MRLHVVVGAGPGGITLSKSLLDAGDAVILVEQGNEDAADEGALAAPSFVEALLGLPSCQHLWCYQCCDPAISRPIFTLGSSALAGRQIAYPTSEGVGGNARINAMIFSLGHDGVFDRFWPKPWTSAFMRRLEKRVLAWTNYPEVETHGAMANLILSAAAAEPDSSSAPGNDFRRIRYTASVLPCHSRRSPMAAVLKTLPNERFTLLCGAYALKVNVINGIAKSVQVRDRFGSLRSIAPTSRGEIILCGGAFATPKLLVASGLASGPFQLKDHAILPFVLLGNWYKGWAASQAFPINNVHGWVYVDEDGAVWDHSSAHSLPRCQLLFLDGSGAAGLADLLLPRVEHCSGWLQGLRWVFVSALQFIARLAVVRWLCSFVFVILVCNIQPSSSGQLEVREGGSLSIGSPIGADPADWAAMHQALLAARRLVVSCRRSGQIQCIELLPGALFQYAQSHVWFQRYASLFITTYFHPCGTCPMPLSSTQTGSAHRSVVDAHLRVHNIQGLRIADASVLPHMPTAPIAATCMAIGTAAAEFLSAEETAS